MVKIENKQALKQRRNIQPTCEMDGEAHASGESNIGNKRKFKKNQQGSGRYNKPYFGNQKEGQGFADLRKKKAAREYLKFLEKEQKKDGPLSRETNHKPPLRLFEIIGKPDKKPVKCHSFSRAEKIAEEKRKKKEEDNQKFLQDKEARDTALKAYKTKKKERFLKLCKKTRKGQPVMKGQMEVLLEKIMKNKGMDNKEGSGDKKNV